MVVPVVNCDTKTSLKYTKNKKIIANGKHITMETNSASLLIIGSGNTVDIEKNDGDIKILGDGCRISITTGSGNIEYIGDGGIIRTGSMSMNNIQYKGDGGVIKGSNGPSKSSNTKILKVPNIYVNNKTNSHRKIYDMKKIIATIHVPKIEIRTCTPK